MLYNKMKFCIQKALREILVKKKGKFTTLEQTDLALDSGKARLTKIKYISVGRGRQAFSMISFFMLQS